MAKASACLLAPACGRNISPSPSATYPAGALAQEVANA
jgi:hypothetical protein